MLINYVTQLNKNMKNKTSIIVAAVALVVGIGAGYGLTVGKVSTPKNDIAGGTHQMAGGTMMGDDHRNVSSSGKSTMSMSDMMASMNGNLKGKKGDEFDRSFLSEMIMHHEGAVEMANLALANSDRKEIKEMADDITNAQNKEIAKMKKWQKDWYGVEN